DGISKGNSYFIINIDDEFVLDSSGKFAIKSKALKEQVNYIASLCCDGTANKLRTVLSKDNLFKLYNENNTNDLIDVLIQDMDGIQKWFKFSAIYAKHLISNKTFAHITFADIDDTYRASEDIKYNASHDVLTGVYNRHTFTKMVTQSLNELNKNYWNALIFIDIDDFKQVNDIYGHAVGDKVLRGVAKGIKKSFRSGDLIGRIGGDEFMVLFSAPTLYSLYSRLNLLNDNIKSASKLDIISVSFGVALFVGGDEDFDKLYRLSDKAMYEAKSSGKNCYCIIDEYGKCVLSDAICKIDNGKVVQMFKLTLDDFIFGTYSKDKISIDYVTPKFVHNVLKEKEITDIDDLKELMAERDMQKLKDTIKNSFKVKEMTKVSIGINGDPYGVLVSSYKDKIIIGVTSR
ncbi:MAG: GGDEF domain-containing protein, partial [Clostridia bacterium]|nr:GGDEF domain-containing protein [Clostridia bacterium]